MPVGDGGQPALLAFVQKLHDALAATENFVVQASNLVPSHSALRFASSGHGYSGMPALPSDAPAALTDNADTGQQVAKDVIISS